MIVDMLKVRMIVDILYSRGHVYEYADVEQDCEYAGGEHDFEYTGVSNEHDCERAGGEHLHAGS